MAKFSQDIQKVEVIVRKEDLGAATAGANEKKPEEAGSGAGDVEQSATDTGSTIKYGKHFARITATKAVATAIAAGRLALNYTVGGIGYRNGDEAMQQAIQRNVELAEEGVGIVASVAMGALYGTAGGPAGMIIGAALGAITQGVSLGTKYASKQRDFDYKMFKEENAIEYRRARAQLSLTTGRLR